ncbi:hypothetical protein ACLOJK_029003 [Asimina triloba]
MATSFSDPLLCSLWTVEVVLALQGHYLLSRLGLPQLVSRGYSDYREVVGYRPFTYQSIFGGDDNMVTSPSEKDDSEEKTKKKKYPYCFIVAFSYCGL